jgi:hypothetical protein
MLAPPTIGRLPTEFSMTNKNPNLGRKPVVKQRDQSDQRQTQNPNKLPGSGSKTDREDPDARNDGQPNR